MKFDKDKALEAAVPSLQNSWQNAVAGAGFGLVLSGFSVGGAIFGGLVSGAADAGVAIFKAGTSSDPAPRP